MDLDGFIATLAPEPAPESARSFGGESHEALSTAEVAECTCPDFCERDHANE